MFWVMHSGIIAVVAVIFARYTGFFWQLGDFGTKAVAVAVILVLSAVNYRGVRHGSALQAAFTVGKLLAVGGIIVLGLVFGSRVPEHFAGGGAFLETTGPREFALALVAGLFTFGGWHMVTYNAEETRDPARTIPRARKSLMTSRTLLALMRSHDCRAFALRLMSAGCIGFERVLMMVARWLKQIQP